MDSATVAQDTIAGVKTQGRKGLSPFDILVVINCYSCANANGSLQNQPVSDNSSYKFELIKFYERTT